MVAFPKLACLCFVDYELWPSDVLEHLSSCAMIDVHYHFQQVSALNINPSDSNVRTYNNTVTPEFLTTLHNLSQGQHEHLFAMGMKENNIPHSLRISVICFKFNYC